MNASEAVRALDAIDADPENGHKEADNILLAVVPEKVAEAWRRAAKRHGRWWYA